jgi:hypothetical protein
MLHQEWGTLAGPRRYLKRNRAALRCRYASCFNLGRAEGLEPSTSCPTATSGHSFWKHRIIRDRFFRLYSVMGLAAEAQRSESLKGQAIKLASEIFFQSILKDLVVGCGICEQSHRGSKLHAINITKDITYRTALNESH